MVIVEVMLFFHVTSVFLPRSMGEHHLKIIICHYADVILIVGVMHISAVARESFILSTASLSKRAETFFCRSYFQRSLNGSHAVTLRVYGSAAIT